MGSNHMHDNLAGCSTEPAPASAFDPDGSASTVRFVDKRETGADKKVSTSPLDGTAKHVVAQGTESRDNGGGRGQAGLEARCGPIIAGGV